MKRFVFRIFVLLVALGTGNNLSGRGVSWKAKWIIPRDSGNAPNTWVAYRTSAFVGEKTDRPVIARIAADSKYWLWVNGEQVVFEGGLKRGPNPHGTYYDEVDISKALRPGGNDISVLVWYFGKEGFSHKSSGRVGLLFDCMGEEVEIMSDAEWECRILPEFQTASDPQPNYRLPESSILYDARVAAGDVWMSGRWESALEHVVEAGHPGDSPWGELVKRPIPLFKDFGMSEYLNCETIPSVQYDTIVCSLPYNSQITPYFDIETYEGALVTVMTDNFLVYNGGDGGLKCEYIACEGRQQYENPGWLNGHKVYYVVPKGTLVHSLKYRETGYNTEGEGSFRCSDPFFNKLWEKAVRTLYVTVRDTYMDCPERERAQWTGDAVHQSGEAFYVFSQSCHDLSRKWLYEVIEGWQKEDGSIYSPVPSGNYFDELPVQSLATVGYYGLWNYYLNTGDRRTLEALYDNTALYLGLWEQDERGFVKYRRAGWNWGDWGDNRDMLLIQNLWYYLGVKGLYCAAAELGKTDDANRCEAYMQKFREAFNSNFWDGHQYRDPAYTGLTDDRVHALAVVSGVAGEDKFPQILDVFATQEHSSPFMEKFVFEAMMRMGHAEEAMARHKKRFAAMVDFPLTTLFEGWGIGKDGYGGGTVNHAWSGGGLTVLSQYACGVAPSKAGWEEFQILPNPGSLGSAQISVPTVQGLVRSNFERDGSVFRLTVEIPQGSKALIGVPSSGIAEVRLNGKVVWNNGRFVKKQRGFTANPHICSHIAVEVESGSYELNAK